MIFVYLQYSLTQILKVMERLLDKLCFFTLSMILVVVFMYGFYGFTQLHVAKALFIISFVSVILSAISFVVLLVVSSVRSKKNN